MISSLRGVRYLLDGFYLITRPGLKRFVVIPVLVNIVLFVALFFSMRHLILHLDHWFTAMLPAWLHWLTTILWCVFFIGFLFFIIYGFVVIVNMVASPFNSFLAEKVECYLTGKTLPSRSVLDNIKDVPRVIFRQLAIFFYYIPRLLLMVIISFLPLMLPVVGVLSFLFHAWFLTMLYLDYPTDYHRVSIREMRAWLNQRRAVSFTFGAAVLVTSMIPVLNCIVMPAAVAGATKYWIEENGNVKRNVK